jgi:hypothetical protein
LVIQPLGWHLTVIPLGSCSLGIVLWFRIICGGSLLPSANTTYMTVTSFRNQVCFITIDFAPLSLTVSLDGIWKYTGIFLAFTVWLRK